MCAGFTRLSASIHREGMNRSYRTAEFPLTGREGIPVDGQNGVEQVSQLPGHTWALQAGDRRWIGRVGDERAAACPSMGCVTKTTRPDGHMVSPLLFVKINALASTQTREGIIVWPSV